MVAPVRRARQKDSTLPGSQTWASQEEGVALTGAFGFGRVSAASPAAETTRRKRRETRAGRNMEGGTVRRSGISNYMKIIIFVKIINKGKPTFCMKR
jgi:hypothetical protein